MPYVSVLIGVLFAGTGVLLALAAVLLLKRRKRIESIRSQMPLEMMGSMAAGIVHDVNHVLMHVESRLQRLERGLFVRSASTDKNLAGIREALDYGRDLAMLLPRGDSKQDGIALDLGQAIEARRRFLEFLLDDRMTLTLRAERGLFVLAQGRDVAQILFNLVINARQAIGREGCIHVTVSCIDLKGVAYSCLRVEDNGCGMSADERRRFLSPFSFDHRGSGIGLAVVKAIVAGLGGRIGIDSAPGGGTAVSVFLPLCEGASLPERRTILLADPYEAQRQQLAQSFSRQGYTVIEAYSTMHALLRQDEYHGPIDYFLIADDMQEDDDGKTIALIMAERPGMAVIRMGVAVQGHAGACSEIQDIVRSVIAQQHEYERIDGSDALRV